MVRPAFCRARNFRRPAISALVAGLAVVLQLGLVDVSPVRLPAAASTPVGIHDAGATAVRPVSAAVPLVPAQDGADGSGGSGGGGCGSDGSPCGSGSDNNNSSSGSSGGTSDRKPEEESNADGSKHKSEPNGGQGSSAPTTDSAADGSRQTETAAPVADGAKRTETPAPVAGGPRPTETPAPAADGARPTETPAPAADGAKRTDTPAPGADGARTTEPAAPAANDPKPTESAAPVADGARPTETPAPGAPADGVRPTPTAAPVADGTKRDEPVVPGDGAKTTPDPAPVDGARPSGAPAAPGVQPPPSPGAVPIAQECEGAENCPNPVTGIPPYDQGTSAACADGSGSKAGCESSTAGSTALEVGHLILDAASFVPGPVGIAASVINAGAYLAEGKNTEAGFAMMGALPGGKFAAGAMRAAKAARPAIGYAEGFGKSALTSDRLQHGTKHLEDAGILPSWSGKKSPKLIEEALTPILERPKATFDSTLGPPNNQLEVKGFIGELKDKNGAAKPVAVLVYKEGKDQGKLATSYVPTPGQLRNWGVN